MDLAKYLLPPYNPFINLLGCLLTTIIAFSIFFTVGLLYIYLKTLLSIYFYHHRTESYKLHKLLEIRKLYWNRYYKDIMNRGSR